MFFDFLANSIDFLANISMMLDAGLFPGN